MYDFSSVLPKRAALCHGLAKRGRQGETKRLQGKKEILNGKLRRFFLSVNIIIFVTLCAANALFAYFSDNNAPFFALIIKAVIRLHPIAATQNTHYYIFRK